MSATNGLVRLLFLLVAAVALWGCDQYAAEKEQLRALYASLDNSSNTGDGVGIIGLYTESTFAFYDRLVPLILDGSEEEVRRLPPHYQQEVLLARLNGTREELAGLSGRRYFAHAASKGWYAIPRESRMEDTLGGFDFRSAEEAWAQVYANGEATGVRMCFRREEGVWKIDEPRSWEASAESWRAKAEAAGLSVEDFVVRSVWCEGGEVSASVWGPMGG